MPPRAAFLIPTRRRIHTIPLSHPIFMVWGANTSVGKTLVSASLAASCLLSPPPSPSRFLYLKPLQTGFPSDSDSNFIFRKFSQMFRFRRPKVSVFASDLTIKASDSAYKAVLGGGFGADSGFRADLKGGFGDLRADSGFGPVLKGGFGDLGADSGFKAVLGGGFGDLGANSGFGPVLKGGFGDLGADSDLKGGFGFRDLGVYEERRLRGEGIDVADEHSELICRTIYGWREAVSPHLAAEREGAMVKDSVLLDMLKRCLEIGLEEGDRKKSIMTVIETAGGVASPGPSGSLQCDLYRPLRLPAILVGDGRLGGISSTISAYESLKLRGYDVVAVVLEDNGLVNEVPLSSYLRNRVPVFVLPPIPKDMSDDLTKWFDEAQPPINALKEILLLSFTERKKRLQSMAKKAKDVFWWPFTQHKLVPEESVSVIDSRCGEHFTVHKMLKYDLLTQQFDACASWWTQGPDQTLQIELARDMGYAAARYGHVMFPENVYEPALECAELLLEGVGKGWASRAFFSDNGSTAIEIALKMAFRKFLFDHGILTDLSKGEIAEKCIQLKVLAVCGSYHGDTLGAMEAQAPSSYTGLLQQPWYSGRGIFLDPPTVFMHNGGWRLALPEKMHSQFVEADDTSFSTRDEIFNQSRDSSSLASCYFAYILQQLSLQAGLGGLTHIGALIIEPVIHGAGGMLMVDPLFQRVLVKECKSRNIPVIFDEVFTGFWRLGVESAAELLHCQPDIACYAKLMTGGIIPLSATLATGDVFYAFSGDSKLKALLHGHSYSAHAMGCTAAAKSIKWFKDTKMNPNLTSDGRVLRELWDKDLVKRISSHPTVDRVVTLGTLFALELRAQGSNAGYGSLFAGSLLKNLREDGIYMRPLGNVIYLMCGPCTCPRICHQLLEKLYVRLEEFGQTN